MTRAPHPRQSSRAPSRSGWALTDAVIWVVAIWLSAGLRAVLDVYTIDVTGVLVVGVGAAALHTISGLSQARWFGAFEVGTAEEVGVLAIRVGFSLSVVLGLDLLTDPRLVPLSSVLSAGPIALTTMFGVRLLSRLHDDQRLRRDAVRRRRAAVFGAGDAGKQVVDALRRAPDAELQPVAILDDDPGRWGTRFRNLRVVGGRDRLAAAATELGITDLVIALPSADLGVVDEIARLASSLALEVRVVPPLPALVDGRVTVGDLREFDETELMPRPTTVDLTEHSDYLRGKRILVTGAGGSIGSELCRQIVTHAPGRLIMLDRDESALHSVQMSIEGRALLDSPDLVVADIRDADRIEEVFARTTPDVVFHAAALKHLPLLELHPTEGIKTNVAGTANLLHAAVAHDVAHFVNVSTDKAANPTSVLGYTKAIAERLTAHVAETHRLPYVCVRFGNVLGSRGSVLPAFRCQIERGGPVTVTHPDATRYMMTIPEAAHLVLQAGAIGGPGDVLVLDMGEPVRILDIATRLIERSGRADVWIEFTGLRPGEKLHEDLFDDREDSSPSSHPAISVTSIEPIDFAIVDELMATPTDDAVRALADVVEITSGETIEALGS